MNLQRRRQNPPVTVATPWFTITARTVLLAMVALSLLTGITGGLLRVGVTLTATADSAWLAHAAGAHAALMICGFLGTVIGVERAVAVKLRAAFLAPLASGAGAGIRRLGYPPPEHVRGPGGRSASRSLRFDRPTPGKQQSRRSD